MRFFVNGSRSFSLRTQTHTEIPEFTDWSLIVAEGTYTCGSVDISYKNS